VFVEALASGLPIVTTAMGGPLETVDDRCGVLVPPAVGPLSRALARLIDDDVARAGLSHAARKRARELWDVETRVRELATALASLKPGIDGNRTNGQDGRARCTDVEGKG
jgi:glycosyltransferase involved in cell wall biosynthesis